MCFFGIEQLKDWEILKLPSKAEKISTQPSIDCAVQSLVITFTQIYNEKGKAGQRECKMYSLSRKVKTGSAIELSPMLREIKSLKESPMLNAIKGVVTSGQDPSS